MILQLPLPLPRRKWLSVRVDIRKAAKVTSPVCCVYIGRADQTLAAHAASDREARLLATQQDTNATTLASCNHPTRGRRKGRPAGRECAAQPLHLALPVTEPSALLMGSIIGTSEIDRAATVLFWRAELARATAAYEAAVAYVEFVQEQYEQALGRVVALGQSTTGEPRAKRAKTTSGKGRGKAR